MHGFGQPPGGPLGDPLGDPWSDPLQETWRDPLQEPWRDPLGSSQPDPFANPWANPLADPLADVVGYPPSPVPEATDPLDANPFEPHGGTDSELDEHSMGDQGETPGESEAPVEQPDFVSPELQTEAEPFGEQQWGYPSPAAESSGDSQPEAASNERSWSPLQPPPAARPYFTPDGIAAPSYRPKGRVGTGSRNGPRDHTGEEYCLAEEDWVPQEQCQGCTYYDEEINMCKYYCHEDES